MGLSICIFIPKRGIIMTWCSSCSLISFHSFGCWLRKISKRMMMIMILGPMIRLKSSSIFTCTSISTYATYWAVMSSSVKSIFFHISYFSIFQYTLLLKRCTRNCNLSLLVLNTVNLILSLLKLKLKRLYFINWFVKFLEPFLVVSLLLLKLRY